MVEGAGLENQYGSNLIVGSNPTLSAEGWEKTGEVLEWPNRRDWKSRVPFIEEPWVRIPPSPPINSKSKRIYFN